MAMTKENEKEELNKKILRLTKDVKDIAILKNIIAFIKGSIK